MSGSALWVLADRLRQTRAERGLSVRQAARDAGVPATTFERVALGTRQPNLETAERLSKFVGVDIAEALKKR